MRIFDPSEQARLDADCRGYILYLENIGILSSAQRELVIDRLLALDSRQIDIEQNCVRFFGREFFGGFRDRLRLHRFVMPGLQGFFQCPADRMIVVDN